MSEELSESELGTQVYWDGRYKLEISNYRAHGDTGEVWFGENSINRVVKYISRNTDINKNDPIVDVGCGNGMTLIELFKNGYENLTGLDYSEDGIRLAESIASEERCSITYKVCNILQDSINITYKVVHDKGTYDAVSLSSEANSSRKLYIAGIHKMLKDDGVFIITSCNWTQEELENHFSAAFQLLHVIPTPTFQFGGKVGSKVTSLVFKKI